MKNVRRFAFCAAGIFVCYFCFGILQEKIVQSDYGPKENPDRFTFMFSLVFSQCLVNYLFAKVLLMTVLKQQEDSTKTVYYSVCSLTSMLAMVCSNMALQFVSYPMQVIGKSAKPIPVMILGVLLANKSYPARKYLFVFLVVVGLITFMYKDPHKGSSTQPAWTFGFGELLIVLSLMMDGLLTTVQERMRTEHKTKSMAMMLNINFWSTIFSFTMIVLSDELFPFIAFLKRYPSCLSLILVFAMAGAVGNYFIYTMVTEFGPLPCAIVTTTRKFFTMMASVMIFGNALLPRQWLAGIIVFAGLFLDAFYGKNPQKKDIAQ